MKNFHQSSVTFRRKVGYIKMKVSIITVCKNNKDTIEQTILSVLEQTYPNIEYIVIDGASTDGTVSIIQKYQEKIAYWISEPDTGIYNAVNKALCHISGDIVGILNSDDWYEPETLATVVSEFMENDSDVVYGNINLVDRAGNRKIVRPRGIEQIHYGMVICHPAFFVRSNVYNDVGRFNEKYKIAADYDFVLRCVQSGIKMKYIDSVLTNFRKGGISTTAIEQTSNESKEIALSYSLNENMTREIGERYEIQKKWYEQKTKLNWLLFENNDKTFAIRDTMLSILGGREKVVIFSAGAAGEMVQNVLNHYGIKIYGYIDNNIALQGKRKNGVSIYAADILIEERCFLIIANVYNESDIADQIKKYGYFENIDYINIETFLQNIELNVKK